MIGSASFAARVGLIATATALGLLLATSGWAQDSGERRLSLRVGIGESNPVTKANDVGSLSIGANLQRWFGVELALDRYELTLHGQGDVRAGEVSLLSFVPQARFRYPLLADRLVPYLILGAGAVTTQINDTSTDVNWDGGGTTRARAVGSFGGGLEYYVSEDVALGVEGKYFLVGDQTFNARGANTSINLSAGILTWGMRVLYPENTPSSPEVLEESRAARRFFLNARYGGALAMRGSPFPGVRESPEQPMLGSNFDPLYAIGIGLRVLPWVDLELSGSNYVPELEYPGGSQLGALVLVKPETLAGKADIQGDLAIELALEMMNRHRCLTTGARTTRRRTGGLRAAGVGHGIKWVAAGITRFASASRRGRASAEARAVV